MLSFLFRTLTAEPRRGAELFAAASAEARQPHWFVEGAVPDSIDGRFAMLATVVALILVRLEQFGAAGNAASVALTERFVEVMEAEHRELGIGDPALGRKVRKLVGALSARTDCWRDAVAGARDWHSATGDSVYRGQDGGGIDHSAERLRALWSRIERAELADVAEGRF